jgi:ArsR family transcriptional regulator
MARSSLPLPLAPGSAESSPADLARLFHALSDPTRVEILERLRNGERCVCELTDVLDASQSRLSFHLKTLREAGFVIDRKEGRWVYYTLIPEAVTTLAESLAALTTPGGARRKTWWACCE